MTSLSQEYPGILNAGLLGGGWDWLLLKLYRFIRNHQERYVKLKVPNENAICAKPQGPLFLVDIQQIKEKFGLLRIYLRVMPNEFIDWEVFDKEDYDEQYSRSVAEINGFVAALESISQNICEISGERGTMRNINGWYRTLSDTEDAKIEKLKVQ